MPAEKEVAVLLRDFPGQRKMLASTEAILVLLKLEAEGHRLSIVNGKAVIHDKAGGWNKEQTEWLRKHSRNLAMLMRYCDNVPASPKNRGEL